MTSQAYAPAEVYENLIKMMHYRGVVARQDDAATLVQRLNQHKFVVLVGARPATDSRGATTLTVVLIAPGSPYAIKSAEFKKLFKLIKMEPGHNTVMFVGEYELTTHMEKTFQQVKAQHPDSNLEYHDYSKFLIEFPKHTSVDQHVLVDDQEIQAFCEKYHTDRANFPKIHTTDIMAIWLGLTPGVCVKVLRTSETAGYAVAYRVCIR